MTHTLALGTRLDRTHIPPSGGQLHLLIQIAGRTPSAGHPAGNALRPLG